MKLTNFLKLRVFGIVIITSALFLVQSCGGSEDDGPDPVIINKTALQTALASANNLISTSVEGTANGQFISGSKAGLSSSIALAQAVFANPASTQIEIDNTVIALNAAIAVFLSKSIVPIDPTNLSGHWTFDDGTGTTVKDYSGNNFTGTFGSVAGLGGGVPQWTADRYGNANKAIAFDKGAKITIPYNTKLNPVKMSVSVWIKIPEKRNNRFMGLHSWEGFKFEVQDGMKSFFTASSSSGIYDRDFAGANPLALNTWYHLVVTFGDGHMVFYVNGFPVQDWDNTPGTLALVSGHDLVFGVGSSKYADVDTNYDVDKIIPLAWGNYLNGSLDEVRIYKSVLTQSQVSSIYNTERVN